MRSRRRHVFQHVARGPVVERFHDVFIIIERREHEDVDVRIRLMDDLGGLHAVHLRHSDVHEDDVGVLFHDELDGFPPRARHANHFEVLRAGLQHRAEAFDKEDLVISQEDPDPCGGAHQTALSSPFTPPP